MSGDTITDDDLGNTISARGGDDVIVGGWSDDIIFGNPGDDVIVATAGGDGNDYNDGGGGTDTLDLSATTFGSTVNLVTGIATGGDIGVDTIIRIENVIGGSGADIFVANGVKNLLSGGEGDDVFQFTSVANSGKNGTRDAITDFTHGSDKIDFSAIDADTRSTARICSILASTDRLLRARKPLAILDIITRS